MISWGNPNWIVKAEWTHVGASFLFLLVKASQAEKRLPKRDLSCRVSIAEPEDSKRLL